MRALLFPGQGSQKVGMGQSLAETVPQAHAVFDQADRALGFSLSQLCFSGPESELVLTANQQPAILTVSVAMLAALRAQKPDFSADYVLGHSLGEWTALVAAGVLPFADAVRLVRLRGQFMQEAVPAGTGAMAAILGLAETDVAKALSEASGIVQAANLNGPDQVVIAGEKEAVSRAITLCKERGAKRALPLPVSAPFHCSLMEPAARRLSEALAPVTLSEAKIPVIANVDAKTHREPNEIKALLVSQVTSPVRFTACVQTLVEKGVTHVLEIGPGRVLSGLVKRIAPQLVIEELPWS